MATSTGCFNQAIGVADPVVACDDLSQYPQKSLAILIVLVNRFELLPSRSDVIEGAGKLYT